ncbi:MAG: hypothetical protein HFE46_02515 [Clostridia bacterium]|jgi:hypothetical protein|nr:hypothetical protein [Clostridia bacterium]
MKKSVWTNEKGIPIISKHFINHGNAKTHPNVPHYHRWGWVNGHWTEFKEECEGDEERIICFFPTKQRNVKYVSGIYPNRIIGASIAVGCNTRARPTPMNSIGIIIL